MTGADALTYLQSQISQDIRGLTDASSMYSFVLEPMGKIAALFRIHRVTGEEFVLDTDAGFGGPLQARLLRFKIRVKVEIEPVEWRCIAVRNVDSELPGALPAWGTDGAFDLIGPDVVPPSGIREGTAAELSAARIEAGWPSMGTEITDASIPAETGVVASAVSFTKGCYPGQELVERMDSRGSTAPRFVRRLRGPGAAGVGDVVASDGKDLGTLTSVAVSADGWVALGIIARAASVGDTVRVGSIDAAIEDIAAR